MAGIPIAPRILTILTGKPDGWFTRVQLADGLGRSHGLIPADIAALDRLIEKGHVRFRVHRMAGITARWEYQVTEAGRAALVSEDEIASSEA